jgi:hypothetical protein
MEDDGKSEAWVVAGLRQKGSHPARLSRPTGPSTGRYVRVRRVSQPAPPLTAPLDWLLPCTATVPAALLVFAIRGPLPPRVLHGEDRQSQPCRVIWCVGSIACATAMRCVETQ